MLAAALPLVGLVSLLLREKLDPNWHNHSAHFAVFLTVGLGVFVLAYAAGGAANRRGDARVLLISIAFLATGGFLGLHAPGTTGVLFTEEYAGFKIANPVGLVLAALFALASGFVDLRPSFAPLVMRHRVALRRAVLSAMAAWFVWAVIELPPLHEPSSEGGSNSLLVVGNFSVVRCQLEASDDSLVAALGYRALRMACRDPGNSLLRVGDYIWEPLGRDAKHPHRLIRGVRERVQPVWTFREVDDVAG